MNLNVLRYVVEVERNGSITAAARQLFISQPNLSRDIHELENEIGFAIFTRSSRGVIPTERGRDFLLLARKTLEQYRILENYCSREERDQLTLNLCLPHAGYLNSTCTNFISRHGKDRQLNVNLRETEALEALRCVTQGQVPLAVLRCPDRYLNSLLPILKRQGVEYESLYHFRPVILLSQKHPLAEATVLTEDMLSSGIELVSEDTSLPSYLNEPRQKNHSGSQIRVSETARQLELLNKIHGSYLYASPLPASVLTSSRLLQKTPPGEEDWQTDLLICLEGYHPTRTESALIQLIRKELPRQ